MSTYRTFKPNARVFFPYKKDNDGHLQLIPLTTIQRRYPLFYTFLMAAKPELDNPGIFNPSQLLRTNGIVTADTKVWKRVR